MPLQFSLRSPATSAVAPDLEAAPNRTPLCETSDNPTGCCPRFNPADWDDQRLRFDNKLFARATTISLFHIPLNMGAVFTDAQKKIDAAGANPGDQFIVLSQDLSPWSAEHLFAVTRAVPGLETVHLSGNYRTRVFEGPFRKAPEWCAAFAEDIEAGGECAERIYFFYTTCPKCAKTYGKNYVIAVAQLEEPR